MSNPRQGRGAVWPCQSERDSRNRGVFQRFDVVGVSKLARLACRVGPPGGPGAGGPGELSNSVCGLDGLSSSPQELESLSGFASL